MGHGRRHVGAVLLALVALMGLPLVALARRGPGARASYSPECSANAPATRDPGNPLDLPHAPGSDPLRGARFFIPGPARGVVAGAIAELLGQNPATLSVEESWASFARDLASGALHARLAADPALAHRVALLAKIASQPEAQRISSASAGGTPLGIFAQTQKLLCENLTADPGTIPIIDTYFLHPVLGGCPTPARVRGYMPLFRARVDAMAAGIGRQPAVVLLELDALGSSSCITKLHAMPEWEAALRYEMHAVQALPHTVVYIEGGYSDSNSVAYTARILNAIHVNTIRGFFTNDTHLNWTVDEDRWASAIARRIHGGTHYVVDTADNGRGPLLNPHPETQGVEDLCNPPGRGLGIRDTTDTEGWRLADAYLWTHPPGNSSGCGGGPPAGTFWPAKAEGEASRANGRLGPGLPSRPY